MRKYFKCLQRAHLQDPNCAMQKHPHHGFRFPMRNLWCSLCTGTCSRCGCHCCAVHEIKTALEAKRITSRKVTQLRLHIEAIIRVMKVGQDPQTFMLCMGCDKWVCPRCATLCTHPICQGAICRSCDRDKYVPCDWHERPE